MKNIILTIICLSTISGLHAQSIENILQEIEQNNTVLVALRDQSEANKIGNKTGIYLENPEIEYHYLWGNSTGIGNRTDFSASQSFDFPTSYYYRGKVAEGKNQQENLKYQTERKGILLEAQQTCIRLIYWNALVEELNKRLLHAQEIAHAYQAKFDKGEINVLDNNKAKLNLLNAQKDIQTAQTEQNQLKAELFRMNGQKEVSFPASSYQAILFPSDFEQWYADRRTDIPLLQYLEQETAIHKQNEKLQRSLNLPKFSVGYMSEKVTAEHFQGVMVGVSIPLWENKNTVKRIKAQTIASQSVAQDAQSRLYNKSKALYDKALKLNEIMAAYKENMQAVNSSGLLKKALDAGEISLIDYIVELKIYYETVNYVLETERDYQLTTAELMEWDL